MDEQTNQTNASEERLDVLEGKFDALIKMLEEREKRGRLALRLRMNC